MERLTLSEARARVAAQMSTALAVNVIDWTQPDREALLVAGLLPGASSQDERDALQAIALALLGYQAHLDYEAGRFEGASAVRLELKEHLCAERAARKRAAQTIHWIHAGDGWHVARIGRRYTAKCRANGAPGTLEVRDGREPATVVAVLDGPGSIEAASRRVRAWLRKQGR